MVLKRQNMAENNWNHFKIVPQGHNNCQLSIVNCQFGEAAKFLFFYCVNPIRILSCILYLISYIFQREELILAVMSLTLSWVTLSLALTAVSTLRMA